MANAEIGLIGLGTMGSALALNIAESGFSIAVNNRTTEKIYDFLDEAGDLAEKITPSDTVEDLIGNLRTPRAIILMVPAGDPVDDLIEKLTPLLEPDDMIIDAGNANFKDTNRRVAEKTDRPYLGMGVSGGEEGARYGPSIMVGGEEEVWDRVSHILRAIAADYEGEPCAAYMGICGAGHLVKSVHNGIEYADMQMIAEVYGIMRDGMGMDHAAIGDTFAKWNEGPLQSFLIEISAEVCRTADPESGKPIMEIIVDAAGQKGTGRWTAMEALELASPVPAISAAVTARNLSARREERATGEEIFSAAPRPLEEGALDIDLLERALIAGKIVCYTQGFGMIAAASDEYGWALPLPTIAKVWRAGCIIRSAMLDDMASALEDDPDRNLMFAPHFAEQMKTNEDALRCVVAQAALHGLPVPALSSGLAYFDQMRTARGTANMIQAQRDFFGWHGFERFDGGKDQHGPWVDEDAIKG